MSETSAGQMRALLAAEFEARGWEYDLVTGKAIIERATADSQIDSTKLAQVAPAGFLQRNDTTRDDLAAAIENALGGRTPKPDQPATTELTVNNNRFSLHLESGAQITSSQVNIGGTQINVQAGGDKDEVLAGVGALVRAGLDGDWNPDAARALAAAIDARDDIGFEDVEGVVVEAAEAGAEPPDGGRIRGMLSSITEQGLGGALGTGISAAFGWLLRNPPI